MPSSLSVPRAKSPALRLLLRQLLKLIHRIIALLEAGDGLEHLPAEEPPPGLQELTPTEREVWRRIADPLDEKYLIIYSSMGINKHTFDNHLSSLFRKLNVHKRSGATRLWPIFGRQQGGTGPGRK